MVNLGVSELLCAVMKWINWLLLSNTRKLVASAAARMLAYGCMVMGMYIMSRLCECKAAAATQQQDVVMWWLWAHPLPFLLLSFDGSVFQL